MREAMTLQAPAIFHEHEDLVDIKGVKLREGACRIENALYFLEQIKNPHRFRVDGNV
jgi:hypothetical protein